MPPVARVLLLLALAGAADQAAAQASVNETLGDWAYLNIPGLGTLRTYRDNDDHLSFQGIPYALPPIGELRWQPPVPFPPWAGPGSDTNNSKDGVRDAMVFGRSCPQGDRNTGAALLKVTRDGYEDFGNPEDCLFLNVYKPMNTPTQPMPAGSAFQLFILEF